MYLQNPKFSQMGFTIYIKNWKNKYIEKIKLKIRTDRRGFGVEQWGFEQQHGEEFPYRKNRYRNTHLAVLQENWRGRELRWAWPARRYRGGGGAGQRRAWEGLLDLCWKPKRPRFFPPCLASTTRRRSRRSGKSESKAVMGFGLAWKLKWEGLRFGRRTSENSARERWFSAFEPCEFSSCCFFVDWKKPVCLEFYLQKWAQARKTVVGPIIWAKRNHIGEEVGLFMIVSSRGCKTWTFHALELLYVRLINLVKCSYLFVMHVL